MKNSLLCLGLILSAVSCAAAESAPAAVSAPAPAVDLFNGKDLTGWSVKGAGGKATFEVKDGVIVGTSAKGGANTFLCTDKTYKNFELEVEVKLEETEKAYMNSGVQVRSIVKPEGGKDAGRVSGWQCEVDPSERAWTGGVQEECGRAWLQPQKPKEKGAKLPEFTAGKSFKHNDWNHLRIVCEGSRIRTWVNGVAGADLTDEKGRLEGFVALQVHAGPEGKVYSFRNIKIREL
ncbi:MAG: hypothetical protein RL095_2649 [Verrucomicrobiota bacterium]|jgi:hypothetical protein